MWQVIKGWTKVVDVYYAQGNTAAQASVFNTATGVWTTPVASILSRRVRFPPGCLYERVIFK
jgi:hypothetical protein